MNGIEKLLNGKNVTALQITVYVICFLLNMLDGMDVLIITFAAPAIAGEWSILPEALGVVFSAALIGMVLGAMFLAPIADSIGRRNTILICLAVMTIGVLLTAYAGSVQALVVYRLVSGVGIGALLASVATMSSEYASDRHRSFVVSMTLAGYPVGATLAGLVAAQIVPELGWRTLFILAAVTTAAMLPVVFFLMPESVRFLAERQPQGALQTLNRVARRMGIEPVDALPDIVPQQTQGPSVSTLFKSGRGRVTMLLWLAFFLSFVTLYFLLSWIPKLAMGAGLSMELSIYAGTVFNLGAVVGIVMQGYLSLKFGLRRTIVAFLVATAALMAVFGLFEGSAILLVVFGLMGYFMQGGFVGLYSVAARTYPTIIRSTGVGWAIGAGRTGAIVGPMAGGLLVGAGLTMTANFIVFAVPVALAAVATLLIHDHNVN